MRTTNKDNPAVSQAELLGAALRYCAVADWFETQPCPWTKQMSVDQAMALFNHVEGELRELGAKEPRKNNLTNFPLPISAWPMDRTWTLPLSNGFGGSIR
ncbi:MAG: hypothetical protein WC058_15945 [Phycisphaeraceae bacterium]